MQIRTRLNMHQSQIYKNTHLYLFKFTQIVIVFKDVLSKVLSVKLYQIQINCK